MARVALIHWHQAEADERADRLADMGHAVEFHWSKEVSAAKTVLRQEPDVIVIDLARLPSHGRHLGIYVRERKSTRHVPIVFVDGLPEKVARVKQDLPDATYTTWRGMKSALRKAIANPNRDPVVPPTPHFNDGTPLIKKLGIKPGETVMILRAPEGFTESLGALPEGCKLKRQARGKARVVLLFATTLADLEKRYESARRALEPGGGLWVAWPKKTSGVESDLAMTIVQGVGLASGLVDNKICAVNETWSGLRFQRRRQ